MLHRLHIRNFAIIDDLEISFQPGLNILTGETGAGKSIILDSLDLLLGGRTSPAAIRAGAAEALVEATCDLTPPPGGAPEWLTVQRVIRSTGRSVCRIDGVVASRAALRDIMARQIEIHGQGEHLRLMNPATHLQLLDRFGGLEAQRREVRTRYGRLRQVRADLHQVQSDTRTLMQRMDMLRFQTEEIQAAGLQPHEEAELTLEQKRLGNAELLGQLAGTIQLQLEAGDAETPAALDLLGLAMDQLRHLVQVDSSQSGLEDSLAQATEAVMDVSHSLRDYMDGIELDPHRLQQVEDRLALIDSLKRKYGSTLDEVIAFGERAAVELEELDDYEGRTERLRQEEEALRKEIAARSLALSEARRGACRALERQVAQHLDELFTGRASFRIQLEQEEDPNGLPLPDGSRVRFDETGIDSVEFHVSANPGEPPKPLALVASGGETARLMLALKSTLAYVDDTPTLIFDEIDQGIGGRMGTIVGRKLWHLTQASGAGVPQILCVTHLPQLAAFGDTHFAVRKEIVREGTDTRTRTRVHPLEDAGRIEELVTMQGTFTDSGRQSVSELIAEAHGVKRNHA